MLRIIYGLVALYPNYSKVVSVDKTPLEAINMAKKKKVEKPFIIQAFSDYSGFVPIIDNILLEFTIMTDEFKSYRKLDMVL